MKCDLFAFGKRTFSQNVTDFNDFLLNFARFYKVFNWRKTFFIRFQYSSQLAFKRWFIEILLFKKPSNGIPPPLKVDLFPITHFASLKNFSGKSLGEEKKGIAWGLISDPSFRPPDIVKKALDYDGKKQEESLLLFEVFGLIFFSFAFISEGSGGGTFLHPLYGTLSVLCPSNIMEGTVRFSNSMVQ